MQKPRALIRCSYCNYFIVAQVQTHPHHRYVDVEVMLPRVPSLKSRPPLLRPETSSPTVIESATASATSASIHSHSILESDCMLTINFSLDLFFFFFCSFIHKTNTAEFKSATFPNAGSRHLLDDSVLESHTPTRGHAESSTLSSGISLGITQTDKLIWDKSG